MANYWVWVCTKSKQRGWKIYRHFAVYRYSVREGENALILQLLIFFYPKIKKLQWKKYSECPCFPVSRYSESCTVSTLSGVFLDITDSFAKRKEKLLENMQIICENIYTAYTTVIAEIDCCYLCVTSKKIV